MPLTYCRRCGCYTSARLAKLAAECRGPTQARAAHLRSLERGRHPVDRDCYLVGAKPWDARSDHHGEASDPACEAPPQAAPTRGEGAAMGDSWDDEFRFEFDP